jgi:hypothetical protein
MQAPAGRIKSFCWIAAIAAADQRSIDLREADIEAGSHRCVAWHRVRRIVDVDQTRECPVDAASPSLHCRGLSLHDSLLGRLLVLLPVHGGAAYGFVPCVRTKNAFAQTRHAVDHRHLTKRRHTIGQRNQHSISKAADRMHTTQVHCSEIRPDPRSGGYRPHEVETLADSIRRHGVLRPVLLRASADGYVIVHGERRWRASQMVGLDAIPAIIVEDVTRDQQAAVPFRPPGGFALAGPSASAGRPHESAFFED